MSLCSAKRGWAPIVWLGIACLQPLPAHALVDAAAIFVHKPGIWSIAPKGKLQRWVVIHNLDEAAHSGVFHLEVIGREQGKPVWQIQRLRDHMAIRLAALQRSVQRPLKSGAVYPESFDYAYKTWLDAPASEQIICETSVLDCLTSIRKNGP